MKRIILVCLFLTSCGSPGLVEPTKPPGANISGNWQLVINDGRDAQTLTGNIIQTGNDVSNGVLNAVGPYPNATCPTTNSTTGNTKLTGTMTDEVFDATIVESDPAQNNLTVSRIHLTGTYSENSMHGTWSATTMISCTGMDTSGTWIGTKSK